MPDSVINLRTRSDLAGIPQAVAAFGGLSTQEQKAARDALSLAANMARLDGSLGEAARGAQSLRAALQGTTAIDPRQASGALQQLSRLEQQAARDAQQLSGALGNVSRAGAALPRTFAGFTSGGLGQIGALAGVNLGAQALVDSGGQALALRETKNGLQAVAGSAENYAKVLQIARQQQELFGGTLQENIEGLTGLTITSRQSGAQLETLIDLSQRLAVLDPSQGAAGARIALSEALSGDPTSLAKRYEIPRAALAKLRDESISAGDKLLIIDQYLNRVGISSEAVAGRIDQDALAFRKAKAEIEEATLRLGDYLAKIAAVPARGLTELLDTGSITGGASAGRDQAQANAVQAATSFEDYAARVRAANAAVEAELSKDPVAALFLRQKVTLDQLNPAQFAYAQSLIVTGTAQAEAVAQAQALGDVTDSLTQQTQGQSAAFAALLPQMVAVSASSTDNAGQVLALNSAYLQGQVSIDQVRVVLSALVGVQDAASEAAAQEERETRNLERSFLAIVPAAGAAAAAIDQLNSRRVLPHLDDTSGNVGATGNIFKGIGGGAGGAFQQVDQQQRSLQASRDALALSNAKTNADKIAIYQRQLDRQTTEQGRNQIQAQINALRNAGGGGGGKPGGRGLSTLDRTDIALAGDQSARLAEINKRLESGKLTELQRKQLTAEKLKLEEQIGAAILKQNEALVDAQLLGVRNEQETIKEDRELAALKRRQDSAEFSPEQKRDAALREQEILLERQKRAIDLDDKARAAGLPVGAIPSPAAGAAAGPAVPIVAQTITPPQGGQPSRLGVFLDSKEVGYILVPEVLRAMVSGAAPVQAAGG